MRPTTRWPLSFASLVKFQFRLVLSRSRGSCVCVCVCAFDCVCVCVSHSLPLASAPLSSAAAGSLKLFACVPLGRPPEGRPVGGTEGPTGGHRRDRWTNSGDTTTTRTSHFQQNWPPHTSARHRLRHRASISTYASSEAPLAPSPSLPKQLRATMVGRLEALLLRSPSPRRTTTNSPSSPYRLTARRPFTRTRTQRRATQWLRRQAREQVDERLRAYDIERCALKGNDAHPADRWGGGG